MVGTTDTSRVVVTRNKAGFIDVELLPDNNRFFEVAELTEMSSTAVICKHKKGWYYTIKFLCFKQKLFYCTDCNCFIEKGWKINW